MFKALTASLAAISSILSVALVVAVVRDLAPEATVAEVQAEVIETVESPAEVEAVVEQDEKVEVEATDDEPSVVDWWREATGEDRRRQAATEKLRLVRRAAELRTQIEIIKQKKERAWLEFKAGQDPLGHGYKRLDQLEAAIKLQLMDIEKAIL